MIISKTPFRISFVGGGTDFRDYYKTDYGNVISTTIDKYIYVTIIKKFDDKILLRYSECELVDNVNDLKHELARECLKLFGIEKGIEITIISDIPGKGSGVGSSSALTVGLINAISKYKGIDLTKLKVAEMACKVEIDILKKPIGVQDQYACALGGINRQMFDKDRIDVSKLILRSDKIELLEKSTMLFYLGSGRKSSNILQMHQDNICDNMNILNKQRYLVHYLNTWLSNNKDINYVGELINSSWEYKKEITPNATNQEIDEIIDIALASGACGAKCCGAGAGGFIMILCKESKQDNVRNALNLKELEFNFENEGTTVITV